MRNSYVKIEKASSGEGEGEETQAPGKIIENIYKVVDPWVNYYKHTDYEEGLERIEQCFNERIREAVNIET